MPRLIRVGGRKDNTNLVSVGKVVAIISPNSAPAKRLKDEAREAGRLVDITHGGPARSFIITTANQVFLSNVTVTTLAERFKGEEGSGGYVGGRKDNTNLVAVDKVVAIVSPNSAPAKRLKDEAREAGRLVDITHGAPTRSFIITTANQVFLSNVTVTSLAEHFKGEEGWRGHIAEESDSL
jgi:regulator of extracellular matrix RemA (YlzA/DUF370 family)